MMNNELKEYIGYNGETGVLSWIKSRRGCGLGKIISADNGAGYIQFMFKGKLYYAHRYAFYIANGFLPETVDHINGDTKDNRSCNLRAASKSNNQWNRKICKRNTSGVKGVSWDKIRNTWKCQITHKSKHHYIGSFKELSDAKDAIELKRIELHREFANHG